jgi:hypothetical protein
MPGTSLESDMPIGHLINSEQQSMQNKRLGMLIQGMPA